MVKVKVGSSIVAHTVGEAHVDLKNGLVCNS